VGTIDLGSAAAGLAASDFEGDPRAQGAAPDIGADEVNVDTDGDGVLDVNDTCPTASGPASNGGCPLPPADTDGDGVPDGSDSCPSEAAPGTSNGCPAGTPPDTAAPNTRIKSGPRGEIEKDTVTFKFSSTEQNSSFKCKLEALGGGKAASAKARFRPCTSPKRLRNLDPGEYRFSVRATDEAGNTDASPAKRKFEIVEGAGADSPPRAITLPFIGSSSVESSA
jgi:hypothetical protein